MDAKTDFVSSVADWSIYSGEWTHGFRTLEATGNPGEYLLVSPSFTPQMGQQHVFRLDYFNGDEIGLFFGLIDSDSGQWITKKRTSRRGMNSAYLYHAPKSSKAVNLVVADGRTTASESLSVYDIAVHSFQPPPKENAIPLRSVLPQPCLWTTVHGAWDENGGKLEGTPYPAQPLLQAPEFILKAGRQYSFSLGARLLAEQAIALELYDIRRQRIIARTVAEGEGEVEATLKYQGETQTDALLFVSNANDDDRVVPMLTDLSLQIDECDGDGTIGVNGNSLILQPSFWNLEAAEWTENGTVLRSTGAPGQYLLKLPAVELAPNTDYRIRLDFEFLSDCAIEFGAISSDNGNWITRYRADGVGKKSAFIYLRSESAQTVDLVLVNTSGDPDRVAEIKAPTVSFFECEEDAKQPSLAAMLPAAYRWKVLRGRWHEASNTVKCEQERDEILVHSPEFELEAGFSYVFVLSVDILDGGRLRFLLEEADTSYFLVGRDVRGDGPTKLHIQYRPERRQTVRLEISTSTYHGDRTQSFRPLGLETDTYAPPAGDSAGPEQETTLPHWGSVRRTLHALCKSSKTFNTIFGALEMRLGREELISVPQYVALCPTGQCNALCEFCSVTINRTGIIKRQLTDENLERILSPVAKTVHMYGLEGNGEPTLYRGFDALLQRLLANDSKVYLITNGSRLDRKLIGLLLNENVDSINFSLNAATPETHRRVMKLKQFSPVVDAIKGLTSGRGSAHNPIVSVSFVVEKKNIHEVQEFLRFADTELNVDMVYIRPLSELGTELGSVEDHRDLQPYESDIRDMLDGVRDYLSDRTMAARLYLIPENFRAVRPDPIETVLMPHGFQDRLLAPRREAWSGQSSVEVGWDVNAARLRSAGPLESGFFWYSSLIPVDSNRNLKFRAKVWTAAGELIFVVLDSEGSEIATTTILKGGPDKLQTIDLPVDTGETESVRLAFRQEEDSLDAWIDFERLRTPAPRPLKTPMLPHPGRWEINAADATIEWDDGALRIEYSGTPGPYITKCYAVPCFPNTEITFPVGIALNQGIVGIGVLNENADGYVERFRFDDPGSHNAELSFNTGENRSFRIVVYSIEPIGHESSDLSATIDWTNVLAPSFDFQGTHNFGKRIGGATRTRRAVSAARETAAESSEVHCKAGEIDGNQSPAPEARNRKANGFGLFHRKLRTAKWILANPDQIGDVVYSKIVWARSALRDRRERIKAGFRDRIRSPFLQFVFDAYTRTTAKARNAFRAILKFLYGKPKYYCQKPWTDMANFSVDGRMDVCCIATGASQERYALGNLNQHSFQDIWNGERMREFRRTVNSDTPLPPCQRCPMAYAYQGFLFDPGFTTTWVRDSLLGAKLFGWMRGWRGASIVQWFTYYPIVYTLYIPVFLILNFVWFRRFKR